MKALKTCIVARPDLVRTACGSDELETSQDDEQSFVAKNWRLLTTSLCLAICSLQDCQLTHRTPLVSAARAECT